MRVFAFVTVLVLALASSAGAVPDLQNDGFNSGDSAGFMGGFIAGEIGASRFVAAEAAQQLLKVHLLFGGQSTATRTITLHVWDDTGGTDAPGTELFSADFQLTGSDTAMQELDVSASNITLTQQFRVGIEFHAAGFPCIAQDKDGTIANDKNYLMADGFGWGKSSMFGLTGDWIIRAGTSGGGSGPDGGATGGSCSGNPDCPVGNFCDLANHTCTFECRTNDDCGGGSCNSLGQCVGGDGGGCCQSGGGASGGAFALALLVLAVVGRRRR